MKVILLVASFIASALAAQPTLSSGQVLPNTRIVGGHDASRYQFPHQISLQRRGVTLYSHICGGSIITHNWVISAAHCTTVAANLYRVVAGILDLNETTSERQEALVAFYVNHPAYNPPPSGVAPHDISLLQLDRSLEWTPSVQPIAIPQSHYVVTANVELSGWGSISGSNIPNMPNRLQQVQLPIVESAECRYALDTVLQNQPHPLDDEANICTGPLSGGVAACSGDSGGPLIQEELLVGVVSWGITPCGSVGAPSVYARTTNHSDWIRQYVPEI